MQENAPPAVRARMKPGGISLRFVRQTLDGETVYLHHYVVPQGRNPEYAELIGKRLPAGPLTREEITPGPVLKFSPFFVDLFVKAGDTWSLLHSVPYYDQGDISEISVKYLQPRVKRGPILLLRGGYTHWLRWTLLGFPDGIRSKRRFVQTFLYGGEGEYSYVVQKFERTDPRGYLLVDEESRYDEDHPIRRVAYRWDGERFTDPDAPWFVIAASSKRREEMEAFVKSKGLSDAAEITRSDRFPKLVPGLWIVIVERCRSQKDAVESVALRRKAGLECYAKRAF